MNKTQGEQNQLRKHEIVDFKTFRVARRACSKLTALYIRIADLGFFGDLLGRAALNKALEKRSPRDI